MNKQDREDYQQDFEVAILLKKVKAENPKTVRDFYTRSKAINERTKQLRRERLLTEYKHYLNLLDHESNNDLLFQVLTYANFLTANQYKIISSFLRSGDLGQVASDLGKNYSTTKAVFAQAIARLKQLTGETYERSCSSNNDLM